MEHTFTDANFDAEVLKSPIPVLVDFWAPWCPPCKILGPIVEEFAASMPAEKAKIGKVNVDDNPGLSSTYGVLSIPTCIAFKDGKEVARSVGVQTKEKFMEMLGL
jgi:thioredoxin 1